MTETTSNAGVRVTLAGLWALLWHSMVLLPVGLAMFGVCCYAWMGLVFLPLVVGIFFCNGDWQDALWCAALWPVCLICVRWFWRRERTEPGGHGWL